MLRALGLARPICDSNLLEKPANTFKGPHDRSFAIRHHREGVALGRRGASARAISDRLVDAGYSSGHETRRRHDVSYLLRDRHSDTYRFAFRVAARASGGAREFASPMAAAGLGSRALAALCAGIGYDRNRLAVRVVSRLVAIVVLSRAASDAGFGKCGGRKGVRWLASGDGMDAAGGDRHPYRGGDGPHFHLPRPHHAADAAGIAASPAATLQIRMESRLAGRAGTEHHPAR